MKTKKILASLPITLLLVITATFPIKSGAQKNYDALKTESSIVTTQPERTSDVVEKTITTSRIVQPINTSIIEQTITHPVAKTPITTSVVRKEIVTAVIEQTITTSVVENPIIISIDEQPSNTSIIETTTTIIESPIITSTIEKPITTTVIEQPIITSTLEKVTTTSTIEKVTTTSTIETSTNTSEQTTTITTTTVDMPENSILLPVPDIEPLEIVVLPATQDNVDVYDIVLDNEDFSTENNLLLFGHVHNSFKYIDSIKVDEEIILSLDGIPQKYNVVISEAGHINKTNTDILSLDGISLLYTPTNGETTIRLITCRPIFFGNNESRWVVVAESKEE